MIHFFRKIRRDLLANSQFFKYLKYAVGEIVLVVLGILIALYINNQNEIRKEQEKFSFVLTEVEKELENNISSVRERIEYYAQCDSMFLEIFIDSAYVERFDINAHRYFTLGYGYSLVSIEDESFKKLKQISEYTNEQEEILNELEILYGFLLDDMKDDQRFLQEKLAYNIELMQKYDWFPDWIFNRDNYDKLDYFSSSPEYFSSLSAAYLAFTNYSHRLQSFDVKATETLKKVIKSVSDEEINHSSYLKYYNDPDFSYELDGMYQVKWSSSRYFVVRDSLAIGNENGILEITHYRSKTSNKIEIIPINKYVFRFVENPILYHLKLDKHGSVNGLRVSKGPYFLLDLEKIR